MRRLVFFLCLSLVTLSGFSQVIFYEDFDGIVGATAGGPGTYSFPSGWLLRNVDNGTPAASVSYINEAWERREDFSFNVGDSAAFSTSWTSPEGTVDDWMWTPEIAITSNCLLSWQAVTYDASYPDGYEVRIMALPDVPTGGTGDIGNQVTNSTLLMAVASENSTWTSRSVDLAAYAGQTVRIAFRNNSNNKFVLLIDDVKVEKILNYDASIMSVTAFSEYTQVPLSQVTEFSLQAEIANEGILELTGVTLHVDVYNSSDEQVYSNVSDPATLASSATATFDVAPFVPTMADSFQFVYYVTTSEGDMVSLNDSLMANIIVTDTVFARDNGIIIGNLGIGAGEIGYLGQTFDITIADTLTSVSMFFNQGYVDRPLAAVIWNMNAGVPDQIIASTDTIFYSSNDAGLYTIPMSNFVFLEPGEYAITAVEFDSTLQLATSSAIFTPGTTWINWPSNPSGSWANAESFGFPKSYIIRANFGSLCSIDYNTQDISLCFGETLTVGINVYSISGFYTDTIPNGLCDSIVYTNLTIYDEIIPVVSVSPDQTSLTAGYVENATYQWIDCSDNSILTDETEAELTVLIAGSYAVIVSVGSCSDTSDCVSVDPDPNGISNYWLNKNGFVIYPIPANETINIVSQEDGTYILINSLGQIVKEFDVQKASEKNVEVKDLNPGWYVVLNRQTAVTQRIMIN